MPAKQVSSDRPVYNISPQNACTMLIPAKGAVSVRRMRGPSLRGVNPRPSAALTSSSVNPPSGPTSNATEVGLISLGNGGELAVAGCRTSFTSACTDSQSRQGAGETMQGNRLRPLCSQALIATCRQCWHFFCCRSALSRTSVRALISGVICATPSSVAF